MIFEQPDGLGVALYIQREALLEAGLTELAREDACRLALTELYQAGYGEGDLSHVEAFESREGWLVFAASEGRHKCAYYHFDRLDDYLDALNDGIPRASALWHLRDGSLIAKLLGSPDTLRRASFAVSEFGQELDGSELYIRHLQEQSIR